MGWGEKRPYRLVAKTRNASIKRPLMEQADATKGPLPVVEPDGACARGCAEHKPEEAGRGPGRARCDRFGCVFILGAQGNRGDAFGAEVGQLK